MVKEYVRVAQDAAREAGQLLYQNFGKSVGLEHKEDNSIVTEIDKKSERIIIDRIHSAFPGHQFIGEETGGLFNPSLQEYTWVIDPLDGTHNYIRGIASYGVSIGLLKGAEFVAGIIYLPHENTLYVSEKGAGAYKNDCRIQVSGVNQIANATMSFDSGFKNIAEVKFATLQKVAPQVFNTRIFGASVRNLTYLAEGTVDCIIEFDDKIWDFAAGICLVLEAGGMVTDHCGNAFSPQYNNYLASNGMIHQQILKIMKM